jgi:hypothetical protein
MKWSDDAHEMTPDERLSNLASIFAAGVLRARSQAALSTVGPLRHKAAISSPSCLEVPAETVLSVHTG